MKRGDKKRALMYRDNIRHLQNVAEFCMVKNGTLDNITEIRRIARHATTRYFSFSAAAVLSYEGL